MNDIRLVLAGDNDVADLEDLIDILSTGRQIKIYIDQEYVRTVGFKDISPVTVLVDNKKLSTLEELEVALANHVPVVIYNEAGVTKRI